MDVKQEVLDLVRKNYKDLFPPQRFVPGETYINPAGMYFDKSEVMSLLDATLSFAITNQLGLVQKFEKEIARYLGVRCASMCNSGSSANLLAISALTSPLLGSRALQPGDEIITVAAGFPTTVNPILQVECVPVFVDINLPTYNTSPFLVANAITEKTKAVIIAHTLGNPYDVEQIKQLCIENNLWLIEDCCDVLGGEWNGKKVGTFGDLSTLSLYPAHHISSGEGGVVFTDSPLLNKIVNSFREWGRSCWCAPGKDNTCGKRFEHKDMGKLPDGYDHKYTYSHVGYNLKATDLQASIALAQLKRLPELIADRQENWNYLYSELADLSTHFILPEFGHAAKPSWFGFVLSVRNNAPFTRNEIVRWLDENKIGTRNLFGGNLTRQPAYIGKNWRIADEEAGLPHSDFVMNNTFWIGVHPLLTKKMLDYMVSKIREFVGQYE